MVTMLYHHVTNASIFSLASGNLFEDPADRTPDIECEMGFTDLHNGFIQQIVIETQMTAAINSLPSEGDAPVSPNLMHFVVRASYGENYIA
jgi:fructosamine-3-kinase